MQSTARSSPRSTACRGEQTFSIRPQAHLTYKRWLHSQQASQEETAAQKLSPSSAPRGAQHRCWLGSLTAGMSWTSRCPFGDSLQSAFLSGPNLLIWLTELYHPTVALPHLPSTISFQAPDHRAVINHTASMKLEIPPCLHCVELRAEVLALPALSQTP